MMNKIYKIIWLINELRMTVAAYIALKEPFKQTCNLFRSTFIGTVFVKYLVKFCFCIKFSFPANSVNSSPILGF